MKSRTKKIIRWGSVGVGVLWAGAVGLAEFNDYGAFSLGNDIREQQLQKRLANCKGTFKKRFNCKSAILRASGRDSFNYWGKKYAVTFAPPLLLYVAFHMWLRRVEWGEERERRRLRLIRIEMLRKKKSRFDKEVGRQRTITTKRRQAIRQSDKDAAREERDRPMNVMMISQDKEFVASFAGEMQAEGYNFIQTDLRDAFLGYGEIGWHIVVTETDFRTPKIHKEDRDDPDFPGHPKPLLETIEGLKKRKENVKIVACSAKYAGMSTAEKEAAAAELNADAVIPKPFDVEETAALFTEMMTVEEKPEDDPEDA